MLLERLGGDTSLMDILIERFSKESKNLLKSILDTRKNGTSKQFRDAVHSLKGISASLTATEVQRICTAIEEAEEKGNQSLVDMLIDELKEELNLFIDQALRVVIQNSSVS